MDLTSQSYNSRRRNKILSKQMKIRTNSHIHGLSLQKKREHKQQEKEEQMEKDFIRSKDSKKSKASQFTVRNKLANGLS